MAACSNIDRFHTCVAGKSTSNTRSSGNGLRYAKVSSPAPSTTYCATPCATASASRSSAYRLRAAMNPRKSRPTGCSARSISRGYLSPTRRSAMGSSNTGGLSANWCAARRIATPNAVLLAWPVSIKTSLDEARLTHAAYHNAYDLDWMGTSFGRLRCSHSTARESGRGACRLKPRHGHTHHRRSGVCVGHRPGAGQAWRNPPDRPAHPVVPGALGTGHGPFVALLLPRVAAWTSLARRPARQAERAAGDGVR